MKFRHPPCAERKASLKKYCSPSMMSVVVAIAVASMLVVSSCVDFIADESDLALTDIAISGPDVLKEGDAAMYSAIASYEFGVMKTATENLTWSIVEGDGEIDEQGNYTAPRGVVGDVSATLHVSLTHQDVTKEATKRITVIKSLPPMKAVSIEGPETVSEESETLFTATAIYQDDSTFDITGLAEWSVISGPGSFETPGMYVVPAIEAETSAVIKVRYQEGGLSQEASLTLHVKMVNPPKALTEISIAGPDALGAGEAGRYVATAIYDDNSTAEMTSGVSWSVTGDPADPGSITMTGDYTAPANVSADTQVTIAAELTQGQTKVQGTRTVAVVTNSVKKISGQIYDGDRNFIAGVTIRCSYNNLTYVTDASGYYSFRVPFRWSGTITPQSNGQYGITPEGREYDEVMTDVAGEDFTATGSPSVNQPPTANPQSVTTTANTAKQITLTGSDPDGDPLTFKIATGPSKGTLSGTPPTVTYTPVNNYQGQDSFTFVANDGKVDSAPATVAIQVNPQQQTGAVIYVDPNLSSSSTTTYNPATRSASGGSARAYRTLKGAADVAGAGETVLVRGGSYSETLKPAHSGTAGNPITFRNYENETATITGSSLIPGIDITNRSYLVIEGLRIDNVRRWMYGLKSHHNIIRNNRFTRSVDPYGSSMSGVYFQESMYNKFLNNVFDDCAQDSLVLIKSERNLIEGNTFKKAAHALFALKGSNFNVLRNNYFENPNQKSGEVYDCEDVGFNKEFRQQNCTKYNLLEGNIFAGTRHATAPHRYNAIQYGGQNGIIRRNMFYDNAGGSFSIHIYSYESMFALENRIFHNVFYRNNHGGVYVGGGSSSSTNLNGNLYKNNIMYRNYGESGKLTQVWINTLRGFSFQNNNILNQSAGQNVVEGNGQTQSVSWYQSNYPSLFSGNLEQAPQFQDEAARNFRLQSGSPMINKGAFLTRTSGAGSGTTLKVLDAGYFYDGFGIPGEQGDVIQLAGQSQTARIVKVDFANRTLTLDRSLSWTDGQGVSLQYSGSAPDIGAYEYGLH